MVFYSKNGGFKDYVTIAHLTGITLKSMLVPVPPSNLQNKFASIIEQVEQTKQKMRAFIRRNGQSFQGAYAEVFWLTKREV